MLEKMNASASLASLSSIFSTFSGAHNNVIQLRQQHLGKIIEYIQTPGKKFISDQTPIKVFIIIKYIISIAVIHAISVEQNRSNQQGLD